MSSSCKPHGLVLANVLWLVAALGIQPARAAEPEEPIPAGLKAWLAPQTWERDTQRPVLSLGPAGAFDDQHMFAPHVARDGDRYLLWYCGSRGTVAERVFRLGLATSGDGTRFEKHADNPVLEFGDGRRSILTPTLLRRVDGTLVREHGRLRMWFSAADLTGGGGLHTLHEATSADGLRWSAPSAALLDDVYAPSVLHDGERYRLWYTDVSRSPWVIRHAASNDGRCWQVDAQPALVIDQAWERGRLFYPAVVQVDGVFLMWYGSYWSAEPQKTAVGFAASIDGQRWHKHPGNPVLRPDASRPWESHYTTSHSVVRLPDGTWRIWYASRTRPPFVHKYFAIGTARWAGPPE